MLRGLPLAFLLCVPFWALIILGAVQATRLAERGQLFGFSLGPGEQVGGER